MKQKTLKVMSVKLTMRDRKLVSRLQKVFDENFSQIVRRGIAALADEQKVKAD